MTQACQLTEITEQDFPELYRFNQYSPEKYPFLLSTTSQISAEQSPDLSPKQCSAKNRACYDILFIAPEDYLQLDYNLRLSGSDQLEFSAASPFLDAFDQWYHAEREKLAHSQKQFHNNKDLPFSGGWFVFLAYELAQQIEPSLQLPLDQSILPVAYAARVKRALIYDHCLEKLFFISENGTDHQTDYNAVLKDSRAILQGQRCVQNHDWLKRLQEERDEQFLRSVDKVKSYIKDGDVFQVNLSRLWQVENYPADVNVTDHSRLAADLYRLLAKSNPAPFSGMAYFANEQGMVSIISSSPERLLRIHERQLESRPIAGTRPRSVSAKEDNRLMDELHQHPKEQAEHIMLIDLIRNDLGRVCEPGSVVVDELMVNESYAHVHHIVSNVIGHMQNDKTPADAIKALFPGGTITGCPKVRCMEIIAELEQHSRGAYTGSMGYINLDGSMDLNILIRTMVLKQGNLGNMSSTGQSLSFRAGAGLVYDSLARKELQETRAKAKGLLRALEA